MATETDSANLFKKTQITLLFLRTPLYFSHRHGMPPEKVAELFKSFSDYNERLTRYQIEHIAGERGPRTRYTPPNCATLQTHGVCVNGDALCRSVRNPLAYYGRKLKRKQQS